MTGYLEWSIKLSLLAYVTTAPGGGLTAEGVTSERGQFRFPLLSRTADGSDQAFSGSLALRAHHGMPITTFAALRVHRSEEGEWMLAMSPDDGPRVDAFLLGSPAPEGDAIAFRSVRLTAVGADMFGGYYEAGEPFDPVTLHLSDS